MFQQTDLKRAFFSLQQDRQGQKKIFFHLEFHCLADFFNTQRIISNDHCNQASKKKFGKEEEEEEEKN
jgi:hypothetical protein